MVTESTTRQSDKRTPTTQDIRRVWRGDRCINASSATCYLQWIGRFRRYCHEVGVNEADQLTRAGAEQFRAWYVRTRKIKAVALGGVSSSLRSLRRVYEVMGLPVLPWQQPSKQPWMPATALLRDYAIHLGQQRGNPERTIRKRVDHASRLLTHLSGVGKSWRQLRLPDIDAFLVQCANRYSRCTTAEIASSVRSFARFLLMSGRISVDLAEAVISPVQPRFARPPRALPWDDVQRLLRAVDSSSARGLRDHALLLMMSTYGFGAGEVIGLQLQDIDWSAGTIKVTRPKTGVHFILPMLAPVAKLLAKYLRHGRPPNTPTRHLFVQMKAPFGALLSSSAVRHIIVKHAKAAGISAAYLGSHVLRHSNASRHIDVGTNTRVLSDMLGHRDSESVSAYVRIATQSLREVSLPVPQ